MEYCRKRHLTKSTLDRRLRHFAGEDAARRQLEYLAELRRQKRLEARERLYKRRVLRRDAVNTDVRNRAVQAFWATHVEAVNWSGMGVRAYVAALFLSPTSLRRLVRSSNGIRAVALVDAAHVLAPAEDDPDTIGIPVEIGKPRS